MNKIDTVLIKYGEIGLKGKNRPFFENVLKQNISFALGVGLNKIKIKRGRIYIEVDELEFSKQRSEKLSNVFGIVKYALAKQIPHVHEIDSLKDLSVELISDKLAKNHKTFKIDTHRASKHFPMDSMEINRQLGAYVLKKLPQLKVNLDNSDIALQLEIREEGIFFYTNIDEHKGCGGLPVGVSSKGLLLLSGGIDSPAAGWMMMKRGMSIDYLHFHSPPYTPEQTKDKVIDIVRSLNGWSPGQSTLMIFPFSDIQVEINKKCPEKLWTIFHRRFMVRVANKIAESKDVVDKYGCLVTGENLGQVASQTMENISVIENAGEFPILRPLIGFDKEEIINIAKKIDTYRISMQPYDDCCTVFASKHPSTKASLEEVVLAEEKLDIEALISGALKNMEIMKIN